ncbi:SlyX family protein [Vibrio sp. JC009]|uniref:SlyX family protein n=1 Tax=Vibrio sp. JC009 TaxID=2912314 RepID=UPI0023B0A8CD|nr:SlyX family protein [Vibrio sp. JC009]WED22077.1 SlyX family protein [Vibrio sp. JC009]
MSETSTQELEQRINDLEVKAAFQEQTIEELNEALSQQQLLISKMQEQMKFVVGKLKGMDSSNMAKESEETPPPHY